MFLLDEQLVLSASDLRLASECEFALVRRLDVLLGRCPAPPVEVDGMLARVAELGEVHEQAELRRLAGIHPGRVRTMPRPEHSLSGYTDAASATLEALLSGEVDVLAQATFFDGGFLGFADFLERTPEGWLVSDTKLARQADVPALLQIAAYAEQLRRLGVPVAPFARLVLGSGERADHRLAEILPVHRLRRARLRELVQAHRESSDAARWGEPGVFACGRCDLCEVEVEAHRDLLLVAGMRSSTRRRLLDAGVGTIDALATATGPVAGVGSDRLKRLAAQARLQVAHHSKSSGSGPDDGSIAPPVLHEVIDADALRRLPRPSPGDIFFDFEGDPLWQERGSDDWGLEYLFGLIECDTGAPEFLAFWAHDRAQEKHALRSFVAHVRARLASWPGLHIYHYAAYEVTALKRLAVRHSTCEQEIDDFLRAGLFVDLYSTVRAGIRVSQRSYGLKAIEPLFMPAREAEVQKGDDSIVQYHLVQAARDSGQNDRAQTLLDGIAAYNREDCISTMLLRDWLVSLVGVDQVGLVEEGPIPRAPSTGRVEQAALEASLRALLPDPPHTPPRSQEQALALVAASVLFHARENKPFWWQHYERLKVPVAQWPRDKGVAVLEGPAHLVSDWARPTPRSNPRRTWSAVVEPLDGAPLEAGRADAAYLAPPPFALPPDHDLSNTHALGGSVEIIHVHEQFSDTGHLRQEVTVVEALRGGSCAFPQFPVALVPPGPLRTDSIDAALTELAEEVRARYPAMLDTPGLDVLLRRAPRMRHGGPLPTVGTGDGRFVDAVTTALTSMDDSYLAVQGPPGTGKTFVGARVIARLVDQGWRVGVCAQSHAAVENVLDGVVEAGVPRDQVAKKCTETRAPDWTALSSADKLAPFIASHRQAGRGFVIGGTAWDFTNRKRVARGELDLVVIDEAGQFSLAMTLAVSLAGSRLLLLGDPAQLPQVSTGTHPEPIDCSALGWLAEGEDILPAERGYFLETTWRMHPSLTSAVSALAYAGRLRSNEAVTTARSLEGVDPGLHVQLVEHTDNSQWSREEADAVVGIVEDLLGRPWHDPAEKDDSGAPVGPRPLTQQDILVISPYNAQVSTLRRALARAGLDGVPVGTVDKFQGREAPVAIISLAASAPGEVDRRGIGFLLDRHRLNVAISRGKHAVHLVRSAVLTDFGPRNAGELLTLGAFVALCDRAVTRCPQESARAG